LEILMSRVTLAQLEAFFWTATLGTVERAARHLHLAQPSISLRIKTLEEVLGAEVFERMGRGLKLSLDGQALLPHARRVLDTISDIEAPHADYGISGTIRIGMAEGFALVCLPQVLQRLHERFPDLRPEFTIATSASIEPELQHHRLDLAFLVNPVATPGFTLIPLGMQETGWMAAASLDLPEIVRPRDVVHMPVATNQPGTIGYRQVQTFFASAGLTPTRLDTCSSVAMLVHLVANATAIAILPSKLADHSLLAGKVRMLRTSPGVDNVPIFAIFHAERRAHAVMPVIETVSEVLAGMDYLRH
jgi:DNA-binding transcriptional LysR family regulator